MDFTVVDQESFTNSSTTVITKVVNIIDDTIVEGDEEFYITVILDGQETNFTVVIIDNDENGE